MKNEEAMGELKKGEEIMKKEEEREGIINPPELEPELMKWLAKKKLLQLAPLFRQV